MPTSGCGIFPHQGREGNPSGEEGGTPAGGGKGAGCGGWGGAPPQRRWSVVGPGRPAALGGRLFRAPGGRAGGRGTLMPWGTSSWMVTCTPACALYSYRCLYPAAAAKGKWGGRGWLATPGGYPPVSSSGCVSSVPGPRAAGGRRVRPRLPPRAVMAPLSQAPPGQHLDAAVEPAATCRCSACWGGGRWGAGPASSVRVRIPRRGGRGAAAARPPRSAPARARSRTACRAAPRGACGFLRTLAVSLPVASRCLATLLEGPRPRRASRRPGSRRLSESRLRGPEAPRRRRVGACVPAAAA